MTQCIHKELADDLIGAVGKLVESIDDPTDRGFEAFTEAVDEIVALWPAVSQFRPPLHVAA